MLWLPKTCNEDVMIHFLCLLAFFNGCSSLKEKLSQKDDWIMEEFAEEAIKYETGLDINLTPQSPKK